MFMMKRYSLFVFLFSLIAILGFIGGIQAKAAGTNVVHVWSPPSGTPANPTFTVQVKPSDEATWMDLYEYNVKVGHQDGTNFDSSYVNVDFSGSLDVKVTYNAGTISSYNITPSSYGIQAVQTGNTLTFSTVQDNLSPRKIVIRVNDSWDTGVMHILTNPLETNAPSQTASNVYLINPGDAIPLELPAGKDTYYFKAGEHTLPKGSWAEVDLGAVYAVDKIGLEQAPLYTNGPAYPNKFIIESKVNAGDAYTTLYDGTSNSLLGSITKSFPAKNARYVRLRLQGSNTTSGYLFSNTVTEFKVIQAGGTTNLALNHGIAGAFPSYTQLFDGSTTTQFGSKNGYGNWHPGESFYISKNNTTVYVEPGAVVHGSISSDGVSNVTIKGRGILDGSLLQHANPSPGEGRTGAIWLNNGSDNTIEGITIQDACMWTVVMNFSTRPTVRNVNIITYVANADGIHFSGSTNGLVTGSFVRTPDDNIVMYHYGPTSLNTVQNSVLWGDDAHTLLIGLGTEPNANITDLTFQNLDVLAQQGVVDLTKFNGVMKLWPNGGNEIRNVLFKDIRIEAFRDPSKSVVFQFRTDERFAGEGNGRISNVTMDNITYKGSGELTSLLSGVSSTNDVRDIYINNYTRNGILVTDQASGNITSAGNVSNVNYTYTANFNSDAAGSAPAGWTSSPGITVQPDPSASDQSVRVSKTTSTAISSSKSLPPTSGIVTVQAKMKIVDKTNWKSLAILNASGTELMQVGFDSAGNIYSNNGSTWTAFMPYNTNQWYDIKVEMNTATDQYNLYMDGVLKAANQSLEVATTNVANVMFTSGEAAAGTYYFDGVKVSFLHTIIDSDFNSDTIGNAPSGWTSTSGATVQAVPSSTDKSVKMLKTTGSIVNSYKTIGAMSGIVTVQAKMNIANKTNWKSLAIYNSAGAELTQVGFDSGGNIYSNNGNVWSALKPYNINQWYDVKLVINTMTDTFDLYVDNVLINANKSLESATHDISRVGFVSSEAPTGGIFYFDNVIITN
ncbi:hypothetical protein A8709_21565 [Paenibacillus pectinilyticus]|uniref:Uncharacterized protein n=1 Tax=Paenibacillus pectinilyticus TaxID=512399 RepID=A0A1C0ZXT9_9BACL|nr:discoidin domain-containing protein [Paenibacillus pectinilyticus]OCT12917.1 hypothetical protein A8709_21565 [Paenibacillus pectinilyticus]